MANFLSGFLNKYVSPQYYWSGQADRADRSASQGLSNYGFWNNLWTPNQEYWQTTSTTPSYSGNSLLDQLSAISPYKPNNQSYPMLDLANILQRFAPFYGYR
jgi:hypothetical protein